MLRYTQRDIRVSVAAQALGEVVHITNINR